ncbi:hypothetical protein ACET3Z_008918 [Daucus carota]
MSDRNMVTWACLVSGYVQNELSEEAFAVFRGMVREGIVPNSYAIGSVLRGCYALGSRGVVPGLQIHGLVSKTVYAFDVVVCNVLISLYGGCMESPDYAFRVFGEICEKNSVSWNSIISVYSKRGDACSVFELSSDMQKEGSGFSEYTFGSLITAACSSVECGLSLLKQILAKVERFGCLEDLYVGSALVSGFARFGLLDIAIEIFKQMGSRNAVTLNGLMVGLVRQKRGEEAFYIFKEMNDLVEINSDSYVVLLSALAEFKLPDEGRSNGKMVHGYVIRTGLCDFKAEIGNGLINITVIICKCHTKCVMRTAYFHAEDILLAQNEKKTDVAIASRSAIADIANTFHDKMYLKSKSADKCATDVRAFPRDDDRNTELQSAMQRRGAKHLS